MRPIRLALAVGDTLTRERTIPLFDTQNDFCLVGEALDREEALRITLETNPDVLLLDTSLPGGCLTLIKQILLFDSATQIIALTNGETEDYIEEMLSFNVAMYIPKKVNKKTIMGAIRKVAQDKKRSSRELKEEQIIIEDENNKEESFHLLSKREKEVMKLITRGAENHEISQELHLAPATVKNHITNIRQKLQIHSRSKLIIWGMKHSSKIN